MDFSALLGGGGGGGQPKASSTAATIFGGYNSGQDLKTILPWIIGGAVVALAVMAAIVVSLRGWRKPGHQFWRPRRHCQNWRFQFWREWWRKPGPLVCLGGFGRHRSGPPPEISIRWQATTLIHMGFFDIPGLPGFGGGGSSTAIATASPALATPRDSSDGATYGSRAA